MNSKPLSRTTGKIVLRLFNVYKISRIERIWKRHAVLFSNKAGSPHTKISECLAINLRTVQRIQKELDESKGYYEGSAARKTHSD